MTETDLRDALAAIPHVTVVERAARAAFAVDGQEPLLGVRPVHEEGVAAILRLAWKRRLRVTPVGGGTALGLGNPPEGLDLALDCRGLNRLVEYRPRDLTITVEAGMTVAAVQRALDEHAQVLALDPPLPERATVGGTLAANRTGPHRYRYGTARDLVIGTTAVLADGTLVRSGGRVVKNVAGYDLNKLLIGSIGTLGVLTRVTFRLWPAPPERDMVLAAFASLTAAHAAAMAVYGSTLHPLSLDIAHASALPETARVEAGSTAPWLLVCEIAGTPALVDRTRRELVSLCRAAGAVRAGAVGGTVRGTLYDSLRDAGADVEGVVLRAAVLPSQTGTVLERFAAPDIEAERGAPLLVAHVGSGIVRGVWPTRATDELSTLVARLRGVLRSLGGVLTVERCPPAAKHGLDVWGLEGSDLTLMRRLKQTFDERGVLSPGRGPAG